MDLNLTSDELQFRDELRAWLEANVPREWDEAREESLDRRFEFLRKWQRQLFDGGWAGISWPKEYGGRGASLMQQVIFWQEMARAGAPPMANVLGLGLIGPTIIAFGSEDQKKRYLRNILNADEIWCQGFSEPNAGSDLAGLQTDARLDGDHYVVNGQKVWTSYGWLADWCEVVVRTDPAAPKHKGLTVMLVDMKSPGVDVRPLRQMTGETEFNEVFFRDVRIPVANVVGKVNQGWDVAMGTLMHERGTFGAGLQIIYKRNMDRLTELAHSTQRNGAPSGEGSDHPAEAGAVLRRNRSHAAKSNARIQPNQRDGSAWTGRLDSEDFLERIKSTLPASGPGASGPVWATYGRRRRIDRSRPVVLRLSPRAWEHHRSRHLRDSAEYHRAFCAWTAAKLLRNDDAIWII